MFLPTWKIIFYYVNCSAKYMPSPAAPYLKGIDCDDRQGKYS